MPRCWIALGGNIGDVHSTLTTALAALPQHGLAVVRVSRCYDTTPVGSVSARYLNAAAELQTDLTPEEVLTALQQIEDAAGRTRDQHWGPRTLDLDLLLYSDVQLRTPRLTLPHPQMWYRRFVLDPLAEIAGDAVHPVFGVSIVVLRQRLRERPLPIHLRGEQYDASPVVRSLNDLFGHHLVWIPDPAAAAIVFVTGEPATAILPHFALRAIDLRGESHPSRRARDVLTAALDDPLPLE